MANQNAASKNSNDTTVYKSVDILDSLVINGDISKLTAPQKVEYYKIYCSRIGLDPMTQPFMILKTKEKETLYCTRSGAAQLNKVHAVSHKIMSREEFKDCYVVTAKASLPDGRETESIGAVSIYKEGGEWKRSPSGNNFFEKNGQMIALAGEELANAIMKAETKSKRRATLDLLGLGVMDESEIGNIADAQTMDIPYEDMTDKGNGQLGNTNNGKVNVANAIPGTAQPAANKNQPPTQPTPPAATPFLEKYDNPATIKLVLGQATTKQQMLDLYYGNQAFIDGNEELKKLFAGKRDEFVRAEQAELAKQQQSQTPKKDITDEEVKQVVARINKGELTAYNKADAAFNISAAQKKTMWDFFIGVYKQAIAVKHNSPEFIEYLISMAQNVEQLNTIYKANTMIVDREPGMKEKWNEKYQSLGHNGNTAK